MANDTKKNYKDTLNLPKTSFPMKASLSQNEPLSLKRWKESSLYEKVQAFNSDKELFVFHDGPPYANGSIHIGHLLNKVLKDIVVRSQNQFGKKCSFTPGWDCHGLPIEHKVMTEIIAKKADKFASLSEDVKRIAIRNECAKYAEKYISIQSEEMKRLLTLADYDNPYLTLNPSYEARVLEVFAELVGQGIVYRQLKPVHWSIANQTALAEAELEYENKQDTAIYVDFEAENPDQLAKKFGLSQSVPITFTIWTTTPWTLPANLAVTAHENLTYVLASFNGKHRIVAETLLNSLASKLEITPQLIAQIKGSDLAGLTYKHPFCNRTGKLTTADYVTAEDGTGLVHTAPGHGLEDYQTGLKEGLDVYCPVQADGTYDDTVPDWLKGKSIWDANKDIVSHLEKTGHLAHAETFEHSYPHDWRSKTPVIFRSTEQWFISVDNPLKSSGKSLRQLALTAIDNDVDFIPDWGQKRLRGMLEARPDWCLSRQRSWGLPIPAFKTKNNTILLTKSSVNAVAKRISEKGSDCWFKETPQELLSDYDPSSDPELTETISIASLEKMYDIFDVWFESGSSWNAVLNEQKLPVPADLYLEGSDQHRGWFHLSLLPALGVLGRAPYKKLLTHGFIVDKDGRKMSKSSGNALNVEDILKKYGAEVTRWWVSSLSFENDIKVDTSFFDVAGEGYRKIRNTLRFLLSNIYDLDISDPNSLLKDLSQISPYTINGYLLEETLNLEKAVKNAFTQFKFKQASQLLYNFCNETLSSFYCVAVKDRLYCDSPASARRLETQKTIWFILETCCRCLAPILPHTADEALNAMYNTSDKSVLLSQPIPLTFNASEQWKDLITLRHAVSKKLEEAKEKGIDNSLDAGIEIGESAIALDNFKDELPDLFSVSRVYLTNGSGITVLDLQNEPRCERSWRRDETVKLRSDGTWLSDRDALAIGVK